MRLSILCCFLLTAAKPVVIVSEATEALKRRWMQESLNESFFVAFPKDLKEMRAVVARYPDSAIFLTGAQLSDKPIEGIKAIAYIAKNRTPMLPWVLAQGIDPLRVVSVDAGKEKVVVYGPNVKEQKAYFIDTKRAPEELTHIIWEYFKTSSTPLK